LPKAVREAASRAGIEAWVQPLSRAPPRSSTWTRVTTPPSNHMARGAVSRARLEQIRAIHRCWTLGESSPHCEWNRYPGTLSPGGVKRRRL